MINDFFTSRRRKAAEEKALFRELRDKAEPEKGDLTAMIIASLTTLLPVVVLVLFLYYGISMLLFG